jgi:predicted DNA binding protein
VIECINLTALPGGDFLGEYELFGSPKECAEEIDDLPDVVEVEHLETQPGFARCRVRFHQVIVAALAAQHEVIIRYPRTVANGILSVELVASPLQMRRLVKDLAKAGAEPRLVSLRRDTLRSVPLLLTPVQRTLFHQALAQGYFDVPRRITLTGLARRISRSKSAVSETLAVVERKLTEFATSAGA